MRVHPVAFVIGLLLGFVLSQTPEFAQQYRQRLGGAVDELQRRRDQLSRKPLPQPGPDPQGLLRVERPLGEEPQQRSTLGRQQPLKGLST